MLGTLVGKAALSHKRCAPVSRIDGTATAGATFSHPADGAVGFTFTYYSGGNSDIYLRYQDASNYIRLRTTNAGTIAITAIVAGVATGGAQAAGVLSAGHRIVAIMNGSNIKVYGNDVLRLNVTLTQFTTQTSGIVFSLASALLDNLKTWRLDCIQNGIEPSAVPGTPDWVELQGLVTNNSTVTLTSGRTYTLNRVVVVPSSRTINLNGATLYQPDHIDGIIWGAEMFELKDGTSNVEIYGGTFMGRHVTYSGGAQSQMSAIGILGTTCSNVNVHNCTFQDLVGFSVHCGGRGTNIDVTDCNIINCGNGLNVWSDGGTLSGNYFEDSEGIEGTGPNLLVENNTFDPALGVAIAIGGDIGGGEHPGTIVRNNHILSVTVGNRLGIIASDGLRGAIIELNDIANCGTGIMVTATTGFSTTCLNTVIQQNTVSNCTQGIYLPNLASRVTGTIVDDNDVDPTCTFGIQVTSPNCSVTNNDFRGSGTNVDVLLQAASNGMTFSGNLYTTITDQR